MDDERQALHRDCARGVGVLLEHPEDVPEVERGLRRIVAADPADTVTATLLAGLLNRQHMSALSMSPLYTGRGPGTGTGRSAWLRALWRRRSEAYELYRAVLDVDPAHAAAANGLAAMVLDPAYTENFVYYDDDAPDDDAEDLGEPDPAWRAETAARLRRVLDGHPDDTVTAANLARLLALPDDA